MTTTEFIFLLIAWAIAGGSPGPATLAIAGTAMNRGRGAGLAVAAGIQTGSAAWGLAAALGLSAVMLSNAWLVEVMRYAGAAYLMYLALKAAKSAIANKPLVPVATSKGSLGVLYTKGLLIHLTNPKAIFSWGAIFAIVVPVGSPLTYVFEVFFALSAVSILVFFGYAILFSTAGFARAYTRARRWFEGTFAVMFGYAGLKILTAKLS